MLSICASEIKVFSIYYCLFRWLYNMTIKNTICHTQTQFLTGNFTLRFCLQQIFGSELETEHFYHIQRAKDAAV